MNDITDRKQAEELLTWNNLKLNIALQAGGMAWWEMDVVTGSVTFSERKAEMLGYPAEKFKHYRDFMALVHPDDYTKAMDSMRGHFEGKFDKYEVEYRIKISSGKYIWFHDIGSIVKRDPHGKPLNITGIVINIDDRKLAENNLKKVSARLALASRAGGVGVWDFDIVKNILVWDDQMFALYGVDKMNFDGTYDSWKASVHHDDAAQGTIEFQMALSGEKEYDTEFRVIWPDGTVHHIKALAIIHRDSTGKPVNMVGTNWDITAQKNAEQTLRESEENSRKVNAEKDKLFSIIAHDLLGPFQTFLGYSPMMAKELPTLTLEKSQKIIVYMRNSAEKLFNLVENLLEWSLMQRGFIGFKPESILLSSRIEEITEPILDAAEKKMISFANDVPDDLGVMADKHMLEGIMRNLIFNAIKFTHKGGSVIVSAKSVSDLWVEISIKDTGIGMNKRIMEDLFSLGGQTNRRGTEGEHSTGLGLIICKDFIEKHGGQIWVESEEGKGSTFYFTLPGKTKGDSANK